MGKGRLEAFSDGVFAILITILVLELKVPHGDDLHALGPLLPMFFAYVLSFVFLGVYWNNHHHMTHTATLINGKILWANLNLLFWLSLVPFGTAWMGESHFARIPTAIYGVPLFFAGISYVVLQQTIIASQGIDSKLAAAVGSDWKGKTSAVILLLAIGGSLIHPVMGAILYAAILLMWFVPDPRIEKKFGSE